jgi:hypothetical protein
MKGKQHNPNPNGKEGNPISLAPMTFEEAVKKMLGTQPPPPEQKAKPSKKSKARK